MQDARQFTMELSLFHHKLYLNRKRLLTTDLLANRSGLVNRIAIRLARLTGFPKHATLPFKRLKPESVNNLVTSPEMSCAECFTSYAAAVGFSVRFEKYRAIDGREYREGLFMSR
jgi:hypothetical protein